MSNQSWQETLASQRTASTAITAAAATSCIISSSKITLPANFFKNVGDAIRLRAAGKISCVVTTPGTARFDLRFGSIVVFDTLAMPLNTTAKTDVPWTLDVELTCRVVGGAAQLMAIGQFISSANIGAPAATAGGATAQMVPYNTAPALGTSFDATAAQFVDFFFTQTVATGSMTLEQYRLESLN